MLARNLREALKKAQNVGVVEERVQLFDDCEVVVRNLRPDEYEAIHAEIKELDGMAYLFGFQLGHVKRAIVELNGQDFRDVQFVDDEEDDPKKPGQTKMVKLELSAWLAKNILSSWGKEAVYITYRKVEDAVARAEKRAKDGIEFITPEESDEDKYRRLLGELKEAEASLPDKLVENILDEKGYMLKTTAEEAKRAMERMDAIARENAAKAAPPQPQPVQAPVPVQAQQAPAPHPVQQAPAPTTGPDLEALMRGRQPMNQMVEDVPQPVIISPMPRYAPVPAGKQSPPPENVHPSLQGAIAGPALHGSAAIRGARQAALEADADQVGALEASTGQLPPKPAEIPILERRQDPIDPKVAAAMIDRKPQGGLNPHYRAFQRPKL
jgi:hypothetical protein